MPEYPTAALRVTAAEGKFAATLKVLMVVGSMTCWKFAVMFTKTG